MNRRVKIIKSELNILIDFDGTLHDTESVFALKLDGLFDINGRKLFDMYLIDIHRKIIHEHYPQRHDDLKFHWRLLLNKLREPINNDRLNLLVTRFEEANKSILEKPKLFDETPSFLKSLSQKGYRLCLSTGGGNSLKKAETMTRVLGTNYFDEVLGEETLGCLKHNPLYYKEALKKLDWKAKNTVSVGDSISTDIYPAKKTGLRTLWVNRRQEKPPTSPERVPTYEVTNLISALVYLDIDAF